MLLFIVVVGFLIPCFMRLGGVCLILVFGIRGFVSPRALWGVLPSSSPYYIRRQAFLLRVEGDKVHNLRNA